MSAVQINFDTISKELTMRFGNEEITNVESVEFFNFTGEDGKFAMRCVKHEDFSDDGHIVRTVVMANENGEPEITTQTFANRTEEHYKDLLIK